MSAPTAASLPVAKIGAAAGMALLLPIVLVAAAAAALFGGGGHNTPSTTAIADIPAEYLALYAQAATNCPGLDWFVAAVGKVEPDHGRSNAAGVHSGSKPPPGEVALTDRPLTATAAVNSPSTAKNSSSASACTTTHRVSAV